MFSPNPDDFITGLVASQRIAILAIPEVPQVILKNSWDNLIFLEIQHFI